MAIIASAGAGVFTPDGFAEALERFGDSIRPSVLRALKRGAPIVRAIFVSKFRSKGVGKGIFGRVASGARKLVKTKVEDKGSVFVLSLELRGFAALQEQGGRTKAHDIRPKFKKALKIKVPSVGSVIRPAVRHPGSNIRRQPSAPEAFASAPPRIQALIDQEVATFQHGGVRIVSSTVAA